MSIKILHFATDEKFIPLQQDLFEEAFPGANTWLITGEPKTPFQHDISTQNTRQVMPYYYRSQRLKKWSENFDLLVVHSMNADHVNGIKNVWSGICVLWLGWGFDYYPLLANKFEGLYLPKTEALIREIKNNNSLKLFYKLTFPKFNTFLKYFSLKILPHSGFLRYNSIQTVAKRIDVYRVLETEIEMLKTELPKLNADHCKHFYYTVEDIYDKGPSEMTGSNILLGNSATFSNNHIEAFDILKKIVCQKRKIITPLNYGNIHYAEKICQMGKKQLGNSFVPLLDWLPLEEYNQKISQCGFVIMNHKRQQAFGNINSALYKGAKVFLRPENLLFKYYKSIGMKIFSIEDFENYGENALQPLDTATQKMNRKVIIKHMSRKKVVEHIRDLEWFVIKKKRTLQKNV
jgi:hypothetical protein